MDPSRVHINQILIDILHKRHRFSGAVNLQATRLSTFDSLFCELLTLLPSLTKDLPEGLFLDFQGVLDRLRLLIANQEQDFAKLYRRFNRKTLNIGVIGRARQGKSALLKSLSGLSDKVIPSREGRICTSVQSTLYHHEQSRTYAKVYFYTTATFLNEVMGPYFKILKRPLPSTIESFMNQPMFGFYPEFYSSPVQAVLTWHHLKECHHH